MKHVYPLASALVLILASGCANEAGDPFNNPPPPPPAGDAPPDVDDGGDDGSGTSDGSDGGEEGSGADAGDGSEGEDADADEGEEDESDGDEDAGDEDAGDSGDAGTDDGDADAGESEDAGDEGDTGDEGDSDGGESDEGGDSEEGGDSSDEGGDSDGGGSDDGGGGDGPDVPPPAGSCPTFTDGELTFNPSGGARTVRVWVNTTAAASQDGPVVLYWYGTGGQPSQASQALGDGISMVTGMGGIVAAPVHANAGTFPWLGGGTADHQLADEIIGCAEQEIGIDERRIHSLGFSAGGLFTSQLSFARSSYFASVATYSGGGTGSFQDASNKFAAMIFYGGSGDVLVQDFEQSSQQYQSALSNNGNFAFLCNHGGGHSMPGADGKAAVMQFFLDHPYGTDPSPYDGAFPSGIPSYCAQP